MLMVVALLQCASETRTTGGDISDAAARCIETFRKMFPNATRDELCSALLDAETRTNELNAVQGVDNSPDQPVKPQTIRSIVDLPRRAAAETRISDRVFYRPLNSKLMAAKRSSLARFILRHAPPAWPITGILGLLPVWITRGWVKNLPERNPSLQRSYVQ
jgi:hypothetical protein